MLLNVVPKDKKAYMNRLSEANFKFTTKPQSNKVTVEVNVNDVEDISELERFWALDDESV